MVLALDSGGQKNLPQVSMDTHTKRKEAKDAVDI